ncbi:uncharacterized protein LOC143895440 isoform X2 [Temnothorax americanus]|uniref:uncharacterized protein LOC143895440 isoform X2 n=1 Tax=Temnothorax americanus TaxID=1964332 RepID=UPI0040696648
MTLALRWQECPVNTYYTINRILLLCVGLWPCQKSTFRYIAITLMTIILASSVIFQLTTFITRECNTDVFLHVLTYSIPWLAYTLKYNVLCLNAKRMRNLMERMLCDWNELNNVQEIEILKEYADIGRFITLITILFIYGSVFCFILILFLSNFLLDITSSKNESRPRQLPVLIECFIDQQKYFFLILLAACFAVVCSITTVVASETLNMSYTHHACGLFEIASCRIEQALLKNTVQGIASSTERNSILYQGIINGFNMYKRAIEFIEMLKRCHNWAYSLLLPLVVLSLSINLYRFSRLIASKEYSELIISFIYILGHFWYMFFYNYLGQKVIDHSSDVFHRIYNVQWYLAPLKAQKLLMLVMQRSMRHCIIVIDGLFIPSFEGFATLKELMEQVRHDWNSLKEEEELKIIHNRANVGRSCIIALLIWMYSTFFLLALMLISPNILNIVMPLNESRQSWQLPTTMEFFIDREKYIELLTLYLFVAAFIGLSTMISKEMFLLMYVQHTCAMFQITSYRIERTVNKSHAKSLISAEKFNSHKSIVEAIDSHQNAIKFVDSLKSTFSVTHLFAIPIGVVSLSINLYLFCESIMAEDIGSTSMWFLYVATHFGYMFFCNYIGQLVIDHSDDIFKKICNTRWYAAPLNTQKCLMMITHRSMKTSTLMVCLGLFLPSLEGFTTLVSSSLSYFMVIYSVRR